MPLTSVNSEKKAEAVHHQDDTPPCPQEAYLQSFVALVRDNLCESSHKLDIGTLSVHMLVS